MRPQTISDDALRTAYKVLRAHNSNVTGAELQAALRAKHGGVAATRRVYSFVRSVRGAEISDRDRRIAELEAECARLKERVGQGPTPAAPSGAVQGPESEETIRELRQQLMQAQQRITFLGERYDEDQARAMRQIDSLRQQLRRF